MKFVYGALLLIASITPTTFIGLKLYKYAPNKYIAAFSTTDGIKIANAARISFIHSLIASSMLCIGSYPRLTEQAGKQRYKDSADKGNAAARHELLHALALY